MISWMDIIIVVIQMVYKPPYLGNDTVGLQGLNEMIKWLSNSVCEWS